MITQHKEFKPRKVDVLVNSTGYFLPEARSIMNPEGTFENMMAINFKLSLSFNDAFLACMK